MTKVTLPGYPRIGQDRELKKAIEAFWKDASLEGELRATAASLRAAHWKVQERHGVRPVPTGDFSLYDTMLDAAVTFGAIPDRYAALGEPASLAVYFAMARGTKSLPALEMTKWFDTNYHYIVPEVRGAFRLHPEAMLEGIREARALGLDPKPVLPGPYTFLHLAKLEAGETVAAMLPRIVPFYAELLALLAKEGAEWVALDEPALVLDGTVPRKEIDAAYALLASRGNRPRILVQTYFADVRPHRDLLFSLPVEGIGLDLVRGSEGWDLLMRRGAFPEGKICVAGVVDGRNVWRSDLSAILSSLEQAREALGDRLWIGPSCSLLHLPYTVRAEREERGDAAHPHAEALDWLAFAEERLEELSILARGLDEGRSSVAAELDGNARLLARRASSLRSNDPAVRDRLARLSPSAFERAPFEARRAEQKSLGLPLLPTTTIGSFPQTPEVRSARNRQRNGKTTREEYEAFLDAKIDEVIALQERIGLDVLVHGEFERADMVEFFAEQLQGMMITGNGWVQSYGTRCVRPPIIFGDVSRPSPMTVRESRYAQSRTAKPVKGMLTGPVTILNWSFARTDLPRAEVANQIALALRDETQDLEKAGIRIVQIDEPAFREGLPLRASERESYLEWAVRAFRLASSGVQPSTQVHTHMCYSEFNEILPWIAAMDADVLSIENSRSSGELLEAFDHFRYPRGIGPGVYDVHSERVAPVEEMVALLERSGRLLPHDLLWANPDCGLKTRRYEEVIPSLENLVEAARRVRRAWAQEDVAARNA